MEAGQLPAQTDAGEGAGLANVMSREGDVKAEVVLQTTVKGPAHNS